MSASATIATANRASVSEQSEEQKMVKKVAVSSFLGNFIEWFDYASYSYFATTIALVFFPSGNHGRHAADVRRVCTVIRASSDRCTVLG